MKLLVKNLHNEEFRVDCDGGDSIKELKEKIAQQTTIKEKYNPELIKLLHKGKVMDDEDAVDKYSIDAEGYVVLVKQLPGKPKPPPKKKPQYSNLNNPMGMGGLGSNGFGSFGGLGPSGMMQNPFQHNTFGGASMFPQSTYNPSAAAAASTTTTTNQSTYVPSGAGSGAMGGEFNYVNPEAFSTAEDREGSLRMLTGMGFEEDIAEKALRATFYNVEAAVDYITSGKVKRSSTPSTPKPTVSSKPAPKPTSSASSGDGGMTAQLQQISQMLKDNPEQLQMIKQTLAAEHPEIAQMIDDNPQAFLNILQQVTDGTNSNAQPNPPTSSTAPDVAAPAPSPPSSSTKPTITLSNHDEQVIRQLQEMGFARERVVEAYLLADRNQDMAVNILLG